MRRSRFVVATALALLALAACDRPPTEPTATRPAATRFVGPSGTIVGIDLGTLPGDTSSRATYVAADGTVYGSSYAGDNFQGTRRYFRWTAASGMQQVSSIPSPTTYPRPSLTAPDGRAVDERAANEKGEVTGQMCAPPGADGAWPCDFRNWGGSWSYSQVFRWSAGAGVRNLEPPEGNPVDEPMQSIGLAINRWGHVAGHRADMDWDQPIHFFWAPVDTFVMLQPLDHWSDTPPVLLNDNDQVVAGYTGLVTDFLAFVWRPDLGLKHLKPSSCVYYPGSVGLAQNATTSVVGWGSVPVPGEERCIQHAMLWRVPAVNRAGYPSVNVTPTTYASTISLARTGGRYFQFYKGTQSTASGPYTELVDWGDGTTSSRTRTSIGTTTSQSHLYTRTGTYWVRVYVKDRLGRWGVGERKVTVTP
jgi:hypothetical protein